MKPAIALLTALLLSPLNFAAAGDGPIVALFDLQDKGSGIKAQTLSNLADFLAARLAQGGYQVVPRDQIKERLRAAAKESYKECYDQSCQIELGRELAAQKTLAVKILRIGDKCQVAASLYDLRRAAAELAATAEADCENEESLLAAVKSIGEQLVKPLLESKQATVGRLEELDRLLKDKQIPAGERMDRAWELTRQVAQDSMVAEPARVAILKRFLDAFGDDNPHQDEAHKMLAAFLPGSLLIKTEPQGALVSIDGKPIGPAPVGRELKEGEHQVAAVLEGYLDKQRQVTIRPGSREELLLTLEEPPTHPFSTWGHITLWSGLGIALFGTVAVSQMMSYWDEYRATGNESDRDRSDMYQGLMIGGFALGGALMVTGVVLWILEPSQEERARELNRASGVAVTPMPDGSGMVFSLSGSF